MPLKKRTVDHAFGNKELQLPSRKRQDTKNREFSLALRPAIRPRTLRIRLQSGVYPPIFTGGPYFWQHTATSNAVNTAPSHGTKEIIQSVEPADHVNLHGGLFSSSPWSLVDTSSPLASSAAAPNPSEEYLDLSDLDPQNLSQLNQLGMEDVFQMDSFLVRDDKSDTLEMEYAPAVSFAVDASAGDDGASWPEDSCIGESYASGGTCPYLWGVYVGYDFAMSPDAQDWVIDQINKGLD